MKNTRSAVEVCACEVCQRVSLYISICTSGWCMPRTVPPHVFRRLCQETHCPSGRRSGAAACPPSAQRVNSNRKHVHRLNRRGRLDRRCVFEILVRRSRSGQSLDTAPSPEAKVANTSARKCVFGRFSATDLLGHRATVTRLCHGHAKNQCESLRSCLVS